MQVPEETLKDMIEVALDFQVIDFETDTITQEDYCKLLKKFAKSTGKA